MTRLTTFLAAIAATLAAWAATYSVNEIPNVHVADRTRYVSNPDGVISPATEAELNALLARAWQQSSTEIAVVAVDDIDTPHDIDRFATDLFEKWGIGKSDNDNGVLILVARDSRHAVIRTGQGMEGALPDILAGRILRNEVFPRFREGDYDGGIRAATETVARVAADPKYADELRSRYSSDSRARNYESDFDFNEFISWWAGISAIAGLTALVISIFIGRGKEPQQAWRIMGNVRTMTVFFCFLFLGMAIPALLVLMWRMKRVRTRPRICPNCSAKMQRLDEQTDNLYLTAAQDAEERYNSVDYDVWLCPECNETDIIPYVNRNTNYTPCPRCGARLMTLTSDRILARPTERREGQGVRTYTCRACGNHTDNTYRIPRKESTDAAAALAAGAILGGLGGRGGGGGGFSGGSFGGGSTMGGGASGSW